MATIKDVAEEAGVSVTTVSRVMNNRGSISKKMRDRVYAAMELLDYQPNEMARSLQLKRTRIIGLVVVRADQPFYSRLIQSLEGCCSDNDYKLLLSISAGNLKKEAMISSMLRANKVDGILLAGWVEDSSAFAQQDMPVITIERTIDASVPTIACDNFFGGQLAARTLIEGGCTCPVIFVSPIDAESPLRDRENGFEYECERLGVKLRRMPLPEVEYDQIDYRELMQALLNNIPEVDGLFGGDYLVSMCRIACMQMNIDVPERLQIVGFDGLDISAALDITTIAQPIEEMGSFAFDFLLKRINHQTVPSKSVLPISLIKRGSTRL